ncbi:MAG: putative N-acetylmannosamine-6-phosphate 2-epimerase [Candidatus Eremiobacteraeota bacterium]|nr:putative N-acetylmannosamine-6-phosphate 2-epimerase [Candidatus Eremiobacteraeota bacterium]MBV8356104.1 putative N-acetylmannosamine-6-phosphate 2-epimerase [Candidatus Eremiobacteraeota bacterium]
MSVDALSGGLVVSIQPPASSHLDKPERIALMAEAAVACGAAGVRIAGPPAIAATRARIAAPIVGIAKREIEGFELYITPSIEDVEQVLGAGATIVATDATNRPRPDGSSLEDAVRLIHQRGALAMADCATLDDARSAVTAGADICATTLCGYTEATRGTPLPAFGLVRDIVALGVFTVCEGGISTPADVRRAFGSGANAIVVGAALDFERLVHRFVEATPARE